MGCSEATGALAAIAVLHSIVTVILAILVALILLWPRKGGVRRKPQADGSDVTYETFTSPSTIQLNKAEKPEKDPSDSRDADLSNQPEKDMQIEDLDSGPPRITMDMDTPVRTGTPTCATPEPGTSFTRKKSRMSIASISSNISKQFGLRRKSVDELEGVELITSFNLERDKESTDGPSVEARQEQEGAEMVPEAETSITAL